MEWLGFQPLQTYRGVDLSEVMLNSAMVLVNTSFENVDIYSLDDDCAGCPYTLLQRLPKDKQIHFQVDTSKSSRWRIVGNGNGKMYMNRYSLNGLKCQLRPMLGERGVYGLNIGTCHLKEEVQPLRTYLPLLLFLLSIAAFSITTSLVSRILRCFKKSGRARKLTKEAELLGISLKRPLNIFRGILLVALIFLSSGAGGYTVLSQRYWGLNAADCLYFCFVWTLGFGIPLTIKDAREGKNVFLHISKRTAFLFLIGMTIESLKSQLLQSKEDVLWHPLERMGIAYFITATVYTFTVNKYHVDTESLTLKFGNNFMSLVWCWIFGIFIFALQIMWITTIRELNYPNTSNIQVTTISRSDDIREVTWTATSDLTKIINYLFIGSTDVIYVDHYYGITTGLMGILSTVLPCFIGVKGGEVYTRHSTDVALRSLWNAWGGLFSVAGLALIALSYVARFNLWPISTILLLSSAPFFLIAFLHKLLECRKIHLQTLHTFGITSLSVLAGHLVFSRCIPFTWDSVLVLDNHYFCLFHNLWTVMLWVKIASTFFWTKMKVLEF